MSVYIDGFNLYHAIHALGDNALKWTCYRKLAQVFVTKDEELVDVYYFTAVMRWDPQKQRRHKEFIRAQQARGVQVVESNFKKSKKHCDISSDGCKRYEEKQTDVAISCAMVTDALSGNLSRQILVSVDTDQVPTLKTIRTMAPSVHITVVAPPKRASMARELTSLAHSRREIKAEHLRICKLPRDVFDPVTHEKVATMPAAYQTEPPDGQR